MTLVSDGCIAHVTLKVERQHVLDANDRHLYELLEKAVRRKDFGLFAQEAEAEAKVEAARDRLLELTRMGMRTLLSMDLPDHIRADDSLELRLLLCRIEPASDACIIQRPYPFTIDNRKSPLDPPHAETVDG